MNKIIYTIEYSNPSPDDYDFNTNPKWTIYDKDINPLLLLKRFVSDVSANDINMNYYWIVSQIEDHNG